MEHLKKSLKVAMMVGFLFSGLSYADEVQAPVDQAPEVQAPVDQSQVICSDCDCEETKSIVGAWVVNALAHIRVDSTLRTEGEAEGDVVAPEAEPVAPVAEQVAPEAQPVENPKLKVRSFGNVLYEEDGGYVSDFLVSLKNEMPNLFSQNTQSTIGTGTWQKIGHRTYKSVDVHELVVTDLIRALPEWVPGTRVRTETVVKLSKCGQFFEGKMTSTFFRISDLHFTKPLPILPIKWKVEGARVQYKMVSLP